MYELGDSLACFVTKDIKTRNQFNSYICVDNYYIDLCFMECVSYEFYTDCNIYSKSLIHTICHEIAHLLYWKHTLKHTELLEYFFKEAFTNNKSKYII